MKPTSVSSLLERIGSDAEIGERLSPPLGRRAICQWRTRGAIPSKHFPTIVGMARAGGIDITVEELFALSLPDESRAA